MKSFFEVPIQLCHKSNELKKLELKKQNITTLV